MSYVDLTDKIKEQVPPSERHNGFLVDLSSIQLQDIEGSENSSSWVHALSMGTYKHPFFGKLNFDSTRIRRFADNVVNKVRGIDLAIDYDHMSSSEAAGWVQTAEARSDGLWLFVEWTKRAAEKIRNKEFRYFSSDFVDEWENPETGKTYEDVLLGGGLTNRPFLKNLVPVNLSELFGKEEKENESMELTEQLREALGLSEDATEQDALEAIKALKDTPPAPPESDPKPTLPTELAENPEVKRLLDRVTYLESEHTLSEAKRLAEGWSIHSDKKFALPPTATEPLQEILVESNDKVTQKLSELFDGLLESGLVTTVEIGRQRGGSGDDKGLADPSAEFNSRVKKLMEENPKLTYADAYSEVSRDAQLFEAYRRQAFAGAIAEMSEEGEE